MVMLFIAENKGNMRVSKEKQEELKAKIRRILVRTPRISVLQIGEQLGIDKDYALKLRKQVLEENRKRIDKQTLDVELAKLEEIYSEVKLECWRILTAGKKDENGNIIEPYPSYSDIIRALKEISNVEKQLFEIKFDAGLFERKIGTIKTESIFLDKILDNADAETKNNIIRALKETIPDKRRRGEENNI